MCQTFFAFGSIYEDHPDPGPTLTGRWQAAEV
jgi:hypothetical protein